MSVVWKALESIEELHKHCRKDADFDFGAYFSLAGSKNKKDDSTFYLTEKAVQASPLLRPFYQACTFKAVTTRLASQKSLYFDKAHERKDGSMLPALPAYLEAEIRAMALQQAEINAMALQQN